MDFDDPRAREVFFELHAGLPREGPGNGASTARALDLARPLPPHPQVLDIACGPGMQTTDLAELMPGAEVTALDIHRPFLDQLGRRVAARGLAGRVRAVQGDMRALPFREASFDLIWCEGAAYIMGVERALRAWRPLLAPGGKLALTEAVWLGPAPPERVRNCFAEYPDMRDVGACRALVRACGYAPLGDFVLPEEAWWESYYGPMEERLRRLAPAYAGDPVAEAVVAECVEEIAVRRDFAACYGYAFLVLQR